MEKKRPARRKQTSAAKRDSEQIQAGRKTPKHSVCVLHLDFGGSKSKPVYRCTIELKAAFAKRSPKGFPKLRSVSPKANSNRKHSEPIPRSHKEHFRKWFPIHTQHQGERHAPPLSTIGRSKPYPLEATSPRRHTQLRSLARTNETKRFPS